MQHLSDSDPAGDPTQAMIDPPTALTTARGTRRDATIVNGSQRRTESMSGKTVLKLGATVLTLALAGAGLVQAQVLDEVTPSIEFNFSTPGARSLAMGGAFLGLADDATAAYANPAGLTTLRDSEVGLELRNWDYTVTYPDYGHFEGSATGNGTDTVDGLVFSESSDGVSGPSFLSYVHAGEGWAMAVYGHQLANFEASFATQGAFVGEGASLGRLFPVEAAVDLEIANYGLSFAFTASESFSVGVGLSYYDFSYASATRRYDFIDDPFGPPDYSAGNLFSTQVADGSDSDWGYNVGFLWKTSDKVWLGGVYRSAPDFDFDFAGACGPADPEYCASQGNNFAVDGSFHVPQTYGLGIAVKPSDEMTLMFDWDHVQYSDLEDGFTPVPSFVSQLEYFHVDDGDEFHGGLEYVFSKMKNPLAVRAGAWLSPAHAVTYSGDVAIFEALWAVGNSADDEWHYTAGLGMVFGTFQVDLAADLSDPVDTYSLSGVVRF